MPVQLISINSLGLPAKPCVYAGDYSSYLWNLPPQSLPRDAKIAYATIARLQLATYESFIPIVTNLQLGKKKKKRSGYQGAKTIGLTDAFGAFSRWTWNPRLFSAIRYLYWKYFV